MCPPSSLDVHVTHSTAIKPIHFNGGSTEPVFGVRTLAYDGTWHHCVYRSTGPDQCLRTYLEEIGVAMEDCIISTPQWSKGRLDLDVRPDLDPRFSRLGNIEVIVEYRRAGVTWWFEYESSLEDPSELQGYIESLGLSVFDVKVVVLSDPEFSTMG